MYIFFTIVGFVFISVFATLINYIYDLFPINKITNFLLPIDNKGIWNKISITVLPILIWSCIEIPVIGNNSNFIIGIILNIFISCSIMYIIKYTVSIFTEKETNLLNLISIYVATIFGQGISYMIFNIKPILYQGNYLSSIIGLLVIVSFYILITLRPPKTEFFRGNEK